MNDKQHIDVEVQEGIYMRQPLDYVPSKTTSKPTIPHTHCHGGWVVAALIIGMAIGFVFGVVR